VLGSGEDVVEVCGRRGLQRHRTTLGRDERSSA